MAKFATIECRTFIDDKYKFICINIDYITTVEEYSLRKDILVKTAINMKDITYFSKKSIEETINIIKEA